MDPTKANQALRLLGQTYAGARAALHYTSAYELLVAVILSAQCTDERVNKVTEQLFREHNTPASMLTLSQEQLEGYIFSCGLYRSKAAHILSASRDIVEKFGGQVDAGAVAVAALYHDASEILTGDMPTPIKYDNPDIQSAYKAVEAVAEQKLLSMLPPDLREAYDQALTIPDPHVRALVKAADKLSAYLKCVEELKAGNTEFKKAGEQTYAALCQNPIPALQYFMEHFLPGFDLTLDELQDSVNR